MKAVWFARGVAEVREVPMPDRRPGEALLRLRVAGICATDLHLLSGYMGFVGIPGHEFTAQVVAADREELTGRRVVGEINAACGACGLCHAGLSRHCPARTVLGIAGRPGCLAEYFTLPEANLHVLSEEVRDFDAVFAEPLAAALRIPEQMEVVQAATGPNGGPRALVVGDGKLGLLTALVLVQQRVPTWLAGHHEEHLEWARRSGIGRDPGGTFPLVVDCTGNPAGFRESLARVMQTGTLVVKSTYPAEVTVDLSAVVVNEVRLVGSRCGPFGPALALLRQREVYELLSRVRDDVIPFGRVLEALDRAARPGALKVLVDNLG